MALSAPCGVGVDGAELVGPPHIQACGAERGPGVWDGVRGLIGGVHVALGGVDGDLGAEAGGGGT